MAALKALGVASAALLAAVTCWGVRQHFIALYNAVPIPPAFSLYLLALSWKAEWCFHSPNPGCVKPRAWWQTHLTLHGLWPDFGDGTYPTLCTKEPLDFDLLVERVGVERLETYWPNVQKAEGSADYDSFYVHEWTKHGTCTGLEQITYFETALGLLEGFPTPAALAQGKGGQVARKDIEDALGGGGTVILNCEHEKYLSNVYICMGVDPLTHLPGAQIRCPAAVADHDDNCPQTVVISSFGGETA